MSDFDYLYQLRPPVARTVREDELTRLLALALPYLVVLQQTDTGDKLAELVDEIARKTN